MRTKRRRFCRRPPADRGRPRDPAIFPGSGGGTGRASPQGPRRAAAPSVRPAVGRQGSLPRRYSCRVETARRVRRNRYRSQSVTVSCSTDSQFTPDGPSRPRPTDLRERHGSSGAASGRFGAVLKSVSMAAARARRAPMLNCPVKRIFQCSSLCDPTEATGWERITRRSEARRSTCRSRFSIS